MSRLLLRIITAIQLTRLTMAFGAIADVWFIILYTRSCGEFDAVPGLRVVSMPLSLALGAGAVLAVGLFAYGAALNDVLDARHDSAFSPDRPIPAGRIRVGQAIVVTVGALMVALLSGWSLGEGAFLVTLLTGAAILFYNAAGKYVPSVGIVTIGLIHAAHMVIPNHLMTFTLPMWLILTHAMAIAVAVHIYEEKRPRLSQRVMVAIGFGWIAWSAVVLGWGAWRSGTGMPWPEGASLTGLVWPGLAVVGFLIISRWKTRGVTPRSAAEKLKRYGAMWQALYGASWLLATGYGTAAAWLGAFAVAGFAVMTIFREITGLSGRPISYRG